MSIETIAETIKGKMGDSSGLDATVKFDCGDDGVVWSMATTTPFQLKMAMPIAPSNAISTFLKIWFQAISTRPQPSCRARSRSKATWALP